MARCLHSQAAHPPQPPGICTVAATQKAPLLPPGNERGFAAETENLLANARRKLEKKNLDMIVANDVSKPGAGFNVDTNIATLLTREGATECPLQQKSQLAHTILDHVMALRNARKE